MKFVLLLSVLFIILLTIDHGESWWGRRRRRRRSGGSWFKRTVNNVAGFYNKNKKVINPLVKSGFKALTHNWGKDSQTLVDLATLKAYDKESYEEFMQRVAASLEEDFSKEEIDKMIEDIDEVADMQPDELELFRNDHDATAKDYAGDELSKDLAERVAALNLE